MMFAMAGALTAPPMKPHILFIISDDLRPALGAYGTQALTPHIDKLAGRGVTFTRAYTQFPWCSPTRQSFMTSRRPDTTKAWTFTTSFRDSLPNAVSLSQHFRINGWHTASVGKIFHGANCIRGDPGCQCKANATFKQCVQQPQDADWQDGKGSWDERPVDFQRVSCPKPQNGARVNWCEVDRPDNDWCDYKVADAAIARILRHANGTMGAGKPLFLGIGFRDDHLPWATPPKWRALFDPDKVIATAFGATPTFARNDSSTSTSTSTSSEDKDRDRDTGVPTMAWQYPAWVGPQYNLSEKKWLQPPELREAMRSYLSNIAFTDFQLGRILDCLASVGYAKETLVLFTGDHGQNVGEHNTWTKMTAWEHSLRVPLIIAVPWMPQRHGQQSQEMVEMLDFYPTLSELAGLDATTLSKGIQGKSLVPAMSSGGIAANTTYAFSQTQRISVGDLKYKLKVGTYEHLPGTADAFYDPSCFSHNSDIEWMGYTVRSAEWRFTEWHQWNGSGLCPISNDESSKLVQLRNELYDHRNDTSPFDLDVAEFENLALLPELADVATQMKEILHTKIKFC